MRGLKLYTYYISHFQAKYFFLSMIKEILNNRTRSCNLASIPISPTNGQDSLIIHALSIPDQMTFRQHYMMYRLRERATRINLPSSNIFEYLKIPVRITSDCLRWKCPFRERGQSLGREPLEYQPAWFHETQELLVNQEALHFPDLRGNWHAPDSCTLVISSVTKNRLFKSML